MKRPEPDETFGNLLADLKVDNLPPPPEEDKPKPKTKSPEEIKLEQLSPQDRELLQQFGGPSDAVAWKSGSAQPMRKTKR